MTFVSYAQNFEDVLLWRALRHVGRGFYIDVGAAHPDIDSVTRAFYDRGWSGINIEPVAAYAKRLEMARPQDVTLRLALGESAGQAPFFTVLGTGLSTLESGVAQDYRNQGFTVENGSVAIETLAAVCRRHASAEIHFLKVDVEGAERAVLAGANFHEFRPWIILVEATRPMSTEETHAIWEPLLLQANYCFVWFDGLNRFYIADERYTALAPHFRAPPNVFDDFLRVADTEWARRISAAEATAEALRERTRVAEAWTRLAEDRADAASRQVLGTIADASRVRTLGHELTALQASLDQQRAQAGLQQSRAEHAEAWLAMMRASTSWRITGPLRRAVRLLRPGVAQSFPVQSIPASPPPEPAIQPDQLRLSPPVLPAAPANLRRPLGTVHQFHSGSAVGDAVTNGMLLTRDLLRRLGYTSDIFVEHRDPLLAQDLRLLDELPRHADYVLILHHSMGYDAFARVVALPATKVLSYHNITPPEFLAGNPASKAYARLGRQQLALLRPHVAAALAMSEYNAIELRALGFDPVRACTLLFDIDALRAQALRRPKLPLPVFTILFVGRITASKGQLELVEAFAHFRAGYRQASRLVLVGRPDDGSGYIEMLRSRVAEAGLEEHVLVTGLVSDAELHGWYAAADLYVSLSLHEGFGVPLVEAMARGVPVLAWPSGAVPYTLGNLDAGGALGLLANRSAAAVAARLQALASDPTALAALGQAQRRSADRFSLNRQLPALAEALALAGAVPPRDVVARAALDANLRFTVTGHASGSYSLASVNRTLALVLEAARPGRARLAPIEGHASVALAQVPAASAAAVTALAVRDAFDTGPHVIVSNHYPVHVPIEPSDMSLALFYWEESLIPAATIAVLEAGFRAVLVATASVAKALVDSGLTIPVRLLGQALDLAPFEALARARSVRPPGTPVTLLHVSSCFPRKGVDILLAAYARAFRSGDPVRLVIKGFPNSHNDVAEQIAALRARDPGLPDIHLIDRDIDTAAMLALYAEADIMVLPTRGEGFNMAAAEAMAAGLPLIVTGAGGHRDFCDAETTRLIDWHHAPSRTHLTMTHSLWFEPDETDLVLALRETVAACRDPGEAGLALTARSRRAQAAIAVATDGPALAARLTDITTTLLLAPPPRPLRNVWVTSWAVRCGVAEYSRHLLESIPGTMASVTVLADARTAPVDRPDSGIPRVRVAWRMGDADSMVQLAQAIAAEDPDILVIQHQPGLFSFEALASLVASPALAGRVVSVTLHTVEQLVDEAGPVRDRTVAALATASRIIVHTLADLERLRLLGLVVNAVLIPQGTQPARPAQALRPLGPDDAPRIGCYGFFLPGKGIPQLIKAVGLMRRCWPGLRLRLVNAEYDAPVSAAEIATCRALAEAAGLADAIEWHTDFLPDADSTARLAECDVVALPTQESKEGSSASLRSVLAAGVPVIVTPLAFYAEAGEAVARFTGTSPEALAQGLEALLGNLAARRHCQSAAKLWMVDRSWDVIGPRTQRMLAGLNSARNHSEVTKKLIF